MKVLQLPMPGMRFKDPKDNKWRHWILGYNSRPMPARESSITPMHYLLQCGLATLSLGLILLVQDAVFRAAIVVAVASTAFTIFVFPNSVVSTPRKVIGGHVIAILTALCISSLMEFLSGYFSFVGANFTLNVAASLSVGLSALFMVVTKTQHPPAAGTAFGLLVYPLSGSAIIFVLSTAIILSAVRIVLRPRLVDLL